jgi:[ribosomal protein S5]-alanine N-acetyltransferase
MSVHKTDPTEFLTEENCLITECWNTPADEEVSVARVRVKPGITTRFHMLGGTCERYIIIEGEGLAEIGEEMAAPVSKGDVVVIPTGTRQRITNTGGKDLAFLAVCTPRFVPENYRDCEHSPELPQGISQMPILDSGRLVLRPFRLSDASDVQRLAGDFAIADATALIPHPYPDGAAQAWINTHEYEYLQGKMLALAVTLKETGELAGCVSIANENKSNSSGELGYWIGKDFWGQGYCTEAASVIINYGFEEMGLNRIQAEHFARNPASGRVMQKLGMKQEGYLRQAFVKWGRFEDKVLCAILRQEWLRRK